jgi:hypothetical protein
MNRFYSLIPELFFILGVAKVLHQNALLVRTYILQNRVPSLFSFLSEMAQEGDVESYSAIRQNFVEREMQTISYELYEEDTGWNFDLKKYLSELSRVSKVTTVRSHR